MEGKWRRVMMNWRSRQKVQFMIGDLISCRPLACSENWTERITESSRSQSMLLPWLEIPDNLLRHNNYIIVSLIPTALSFTVPAPFANANTPFAASQHPL